MAPCSSTTAANPPRAASNATRGAVLARQLGGGRGERRHRHQIAVDLAGRPVRRPRRRGRAPAWSRARRRTVSRARSTRTRGDAGGVERARERRRRRRAVEDDHLALGGDRAHAPVERQPAAGARGDHARAIVVGERQVLIVAAGRVEVAARPHAQQPIAGHHGQEPRPPSGAVVLRDRRRSPSRARRARAPAARAASASAAARARCRPPRRAASRRGPPARRRARRAAPGAASAIARAAASPAGPPPTTQTSSASSRGASRVAAGASGSVPEPPISRTSLRNSALPARLPVIIVWWSIPSGNSQSAAASRSTSALGKAFWRAQARLGARRRQAGALVGAAVDAQQAGGAVAVEAEEPARPVVLRRARQRLDPGGVQRDGDRLAREGGDPRRPRSRW